MPLRRLYKSLVSFLALNHGISIQTYKRLHHPTSAEYADFLRKKNFFYSIGDDVTVNVAADITDPQYVSIGNNCSLSACTLIGHDGSVRIINNLYKKKLDAVGKIDIRDNCFIGHGAIIMPNVTIGPNSIVAAGAVVTKDVPSGMVVGGVPAKPISSIDALVTRMETRSNTYPWISLIRERAGSFDPAMEPELVRQRVASFYGKPSRED
jgi:acetyltransferase-like isoleucine patch superfamily enzyme